MNRRHRVVVVGLLGLLAALPYMAVPEGGQELAAADPMPLPMRPDRQVPDLRGVYEGFSQPVGQREPFPVFTELMVPSQDQRRLEGAFIICIGAEPELYSLRGTVAESGTVLAEGDGETQGIIVQWEFREFSPGAAVLQGRNRTTRFPATFRSSILLRDFAFDENNPPADASGTYEGQAVSALDGQGQLWTLDARRREGSRTGFDANLQLGEEAGIIDGGRFTLNGDGDLVLIGAGAGVQLQVLAQWFNPQPGMPARIEGIYAIHSISDPDDKNLGGPDTIEDVGTFILCKSADLIEPIPPGFE